MCNTALLWALWDPSCNWELCWLILKLVWECNCSPLFARARSVSQSRTAAPTVWLPRLQRSRVFDTWSESIMRVKGWVMVHERFERPAPYSATLDAQWGLLSIHFPWGCNYIFTHWRGRCQKWVMGILHVFFFFFFFCPHLLQDQIKHKRPSVCSCVLIHTPFDRGLQPFSCYDNA